MPLLARDLKRGASPRRDHEAEVCLEPLVGRAPVWPDVPATAVTMGPRQPETAYVSNATLDDRGRSERKRGYLRGMRRGGEGGGEVQKETEAVWSGAEAPVHSRRERRVPETDNRDALDPVELSAERAYMHASRRKRRFGVHRSAHRQGHDPSANPAEGTSGGQTPGALGEQSARAHLTQ